MQNYGKLNISLMDIMVLLYHIKVGESVPDVGYEDAERPIEEILEELKRQSTVRHKTLERALWSCNLMDEAGLFWHPEGITFKDMLRRVVPVDYRFDREYNLIVRKEKDV